MCVQAVAGIVADGRQVVNRACEESRSYKRLMADLQALLHLLNVLLKSRFLPIRCMIWTLKLSLLLQLLW